MIRITKIVKKESIFDILNDPLVLKVELIRSKNIDLTNDTVCRVVIYQNISPQITHNFYTVLRNIVTDKNKNNTWKSTNNRDFLSGLLGNSFIRKVNYFKIKQIELEEDVSFGMPKIIKQFIKKYS